MNDELLELSVELKTTGWKRIHVSTAAFRKELHAKGTDKFRRMQIYAWLLYRKHRRTGFRKR